MGLFLVIIWLLIAASCVVYGNLKDNKFMLVLGAVMTLLVCMVVAIE